MKSFNRSNKPARLSSSSLEDIPEALREVPVEEAGAPSRSRLIIWGLVATALLGTIGLGIFIVQPWANPGARATADGAGGVPGNANPTGATTASGQLPSGTILGHFPFAEAPENDLKSIVSDGSIRLRTAAADKFLAMVEAARAEGVNLVPLSGFRSKAEQQHLFFEVKAERGQVAQKRAEVSAPPGYSEHHTGYAIDIGDAMAPSTDLSPTFESTAAFQWLQKNAPYYSFELSFPKGNLQGVSYEPWHWRFVGDQASLEAFYKVRNFSRNANQSSPRSVSP